VTFQPTFLHADAPGVYHLDHRLVPEVSAMFAAMFSRMPSGGIAARYEQIVDAIAADYYEDLRSSEEEKVSFTYPETWAEGKDFVHPDILKRFLSRAESRLCKYPIHPKVQKFFDQFVLRYGHSSIMELTGNPAVYTEGISWYTAYLLFDDPLCAGQEFSTRAVRHKNWPMARECYVNVKGMYGESEPEFVGKMPERKELKIGVEIQVDFGDIEMKEVDFDVPHPVLRELHDDYFEAFEAEVEAWRMLFTEAENRAAYSILDDEPFRPALDRARCLIPGTISTGCCHTGHLRGRARILRDGSLLAHRSGAAAAVEVWDGIREGYTRALPGLSGMGLREAVYGADAVLPAHLLVMDAETGAEVEVNLHPTKGFIHPRAKPRPKGLRTYLDPTFNQLARVDITFRCSLAVSRDWHRHRTMYPWSLDVVRDENGLIKLHGGYELKSAVARDRISALLEKSTRAFDAFMAEGNQVQAMLCLPLGTEMAMSGQGGLRDVVYMLELRAYAHGANFEYKKQALEALELLKAQLREAEIHDSPGTRHLPIPVNLMDALGFREDP